MERISSTNDGLRNFKSRIYVRNNRWWLFTLASPSTPPTPLPPIPPSPPQPLPTTARTLTTTIATTPKA